MKTTKKMSGKTKPKHMHIGSIRQTQHTFFGKKCRPKIGVRGLFAHEYRHCYLSLYANLPTVLAYPSKGKACLHEPSRFTLKK